MKLTNEQDTILNKLLEFIISDDKEIILQGRAGTGKTYILSALVEQYKSLKIIGLEDIEFIFCATTHKAVEALEEKGIKATTLHRAIGMNIKDELTYKPINIYTNRVLIIDECSYINYKQLECIRETGSKVIYVGDKNQLTPVGLNHSPVYYSDIPMVELKTVIRQQNAKEIANYCNLLVDAIENVKSVPDIVYGNDIIYLDSNRFNKAIKNLYPFNPNTRVLGLTNSTIQRINNKIGGDIKIGDILVNNNHSYSIPNNALVEVVNIHTSNKYLWDLTVLYKSKLCRVLVPKIKEAKKYIQDSFSICDLRKPYAQTIHKAQGSTYEDVYIYLTDLRYAKTKEDLKRLLYVAFSRATNKVYVTGELK